MALTAPTLFDFCTRWQNHDRQDVLPMPDRIELAGTVRRAALGYDHTPLVLLEADSKGTCHVECRCLSDEVLLRARVGSEVTVTGFCRGLEDSVTAVMDRCELVAVNGRRARNGPGPKASNARFQDATVSRCTFCGCAAPEVHRLVTIGEKSICDRCLGEYSRRLSANGGAQDLGSGPRVAELGVEPRGGGGRRARRLLRWLRRRCQSSSPPGAR